MSTRGLLALVVGLLVAVVALTITLIVVYEERLPCSDSKSTRAHSTTFPPEWLRVIVMSDIHLDILYKDTASAVSDRPLQENERYIFPCHNDSNPALYNFSAKFGRVKCDSPPALLDSALEGIVAVDRSDAADLILVTGDKSGHFLYEAPDGTSFNGSMVLAAQKTVAEKLAKRFPRRRVIMTMGNNDVALHWQIPEKWWYEELYKLWSPLILCEECEPDRFGTGQHVNESEFSATFLRGGYYKVTVTPKLDFLVLNTLYWTSYAWKETKPWREEIMNIADEQMNWLEENLRSASRNNQMVFIVGHVPIGLDPYRYGTNGLTVRQFWFGNYTKDYLQLLFQFRSTIAGQMFAHLHKDDFHVHQYEDKYGVYQTGPLLLVPSISPIYENNPSFRWVYFSSEDWQLADYTQYWGDLVQGNVQGNMTWEKDYTFSVAYPSSVYKTITAGRLEAIWSEILQNNTVWREFMSHRQCRFANTIPSYSRDHLYCVAKSPTLDEYSLCREKYPAEPFS